MSSQCIVPNWNVSHQRQDINQGEEGNRSSHVALDNHFQQQLHHNHHPQSFSHQLVSMSNFEVTELTWENGQLAMHELGGLIPAPTTSTATSALPNASWGGGVGRASDTLESIVHQATYYNTEQTPNLMPNSAHQHSGYQSRENVGSSVVASSGRKWDDNSAQIQPTGAPPPPPSLELVKKRTRSESENCGARNYTTNDRDMSVCASANAAFCKDNNTDNDATMMTWASFESPRSTRTKTTTDEDSACHGGSENQEEDQKTKGESGRSYTTRKGRAAAVHNQSERRRRDRINQKMKALQKLVPNASKTDKASMLDEVIEYLKQLQAQVQMMTSARFMPQLMMPLGMQQQLHQMSLMASVGMGAGLGMGIGTLDATTMKGTHPGPQAISRIIHPNHIATSASTFVVPPAFVVPQMISAINQQSNPVDPGTSNSASLQNPYSALLAQSMNMELYNRMAALQRQQQQQTSSQQTSSRLQ